MEITTHYQKTHPVMILQRDDWSLKLKGLYSILFLVGGYKNETIQEKIKRCISTEDTEIEELLEKLVEEGFLQKTNITGEDQ